MPRSSQRFVVGFLLSAGVVLCLAGVAAVALGLIDPRLISDQLPPEAVLDAAAVGGAAVALGAVTTFLGAVHIAIAIALRRQVGVAVTAAVVLAAIMAMLALGFAISAAVSMASAAAPAIILAPAAIGLGAATIGYVVTTARIIGARSRPT